MNHLNWIALTSLLIYSLSWTSHCHVHAQELMGADTSLAKIQSTVERQSANSDDALNSGQDDDLDARLKVFQERRDQLAPDMAAKQWLDLVDLWSEGGTDEDVYFYAGESGFGQLIEALPQPEAWRALRDQIQQRAEPEELPARMQFHGLRMLGFRLANDIEQFRAEILAAQSALKAARRPKAPSGLGGFLRRALGSANYEDSFRLEQLATPLDELQQAHDPVSRVAAFEEALEQERFEYRAAVPDLLKLVGRERATELLKKVLRLKNIAVDFDDAGKTVDLAREVARSMLNEISTPMWSLCQSLDTEDLYEAFAKLPQSADAPGYEQEAATSWYVLSHILDGRAQDALPILQLKLGDQADNLVFYHLQAQLGQFLLSQRHGPAIQSFLSEVLDAAPELPLWETFVTVSARRGSGDELLALLEKHLNNADLSSELKQRLLKTRGDSLLAVDRVEEAMEVYAQFLATTATTPKGSTEFESLEALKFHVAVRMADVGRLLDNANWLAAGIEAAENWLNQADPREPQAEELIRVLIELERFAQAEAILVDQIARSVVQQEADKAKEDSGFDVYFGNDPTADLLSLLVWVYHAAGQHGDVLALLDDAPWWGVKDVNDLLSNSLLGGYGQENGAYGKVLLAHLVADALAESGRTAEALEICKAILRDEPGHDPTWQLTLRIADDFEAIARAAFEADQFEERPLIWLAQLYLTQGKVDAAAEAIQQAVAIDPSDGEQGKGDRMRAYAVYSEILKRQGDDAKADTFASAVRAIRKAEVADQFYVTGMLRRGIQQYEESLEEFADAYCIQSRLAVQFAALGDYDKATEHYEKAFQLMPDSFGRVESHCFGCEQVFEGELAGGVAERVFNKLVQENPGNPRVHYLLGYLHAEREQYEQAAKSLRQAVRLDPDYLSAWSKLLEIADHVKLPKNEYDQVVFSILRLDPHGRHSSPEYFAVGDLAQLWQLVQEETEATPVEKLYRLKAAAARLESAEEDPAMSSFYYSHSTRDSTFSQHWDLQMLGQFLDASRF